MKNKQSEFISAMLHSNGLIKPETKKCSMCNQIKPIGEFSKNFRRSDNRISACKVCVEKIEKPKRVNKKMERDWFKEFMPI